MHKIVYACSVSAVALTISSAVLAGDNNSAYIDQFGGGSSTATIKQDGNMNAFGLLGSGAGVMSDQHVRQGSIYASPGNAKNTLTSTQTGDNNKIANYGGGSQSVGDTATFIQNNAAAGAGALGNEIRGFYSGSRPGSAPSNTLAITQTGDNNLVHYVFQDHNKNSATIEMIGNGNGRFNNTLGSGNYQATRLFGTAGGPGIPNDGHGNINVATLGQDGSSSDDAGATAILRAKGDGNSFNTGQSGTKLFLSNIQTGNGNFIGASQNGTATTLTNTQTGNYNVLLASQGVSGASTGNSIVFAQGQAGASKNMAEVVQNGSSNVLDGYQLGSSNYLLVSQQGDSNKVSAFTTGDSNTITSYQTAVLGGNTLTAVQTGYSNTVSNTQIGANNVSAANQMGSNNSVTFMQSKGK